MDKSSLTALIAEAGLKRLSPGLEAQARPTVFVATESSSQKKPALGASRIGGDPDLPAGLPWPLREGRPLSFLAQFRLEDLSGFEPQGLLPARGQLYFFYDAVECPWGFDPKHRGGWKVFHSAAPTLVPSAAPKSLAESGRFGPCTVRFEAGSTLPSVHSGYVHSLGLSDDEVDAYVELEQKVGGPVAPGDGCHRFFGHPDQVQGDMEDECQFVSNGIYCGGSDYYDDPRAAALQPGAKDWRLLLQIDSDDRAGMMWGDLGMLYFWIREQDLRSGSFEEVWTVLQCC